MKLHRFFSKLCAWLSAMPLSLLLLTGCQGSMSAAAPDLALSKAWRMDPSASANFTLQDAEKATDWETLPESNTWGFGKETVWVRLQLKAADQETRMPWVVRVALWSHHTANGADPRPTHHLFWKQVRLAIRVLHRLR